MTRVFEQRFFRKKSFFVHYASNVSDNFFPSFQILLSARWVIACLLRFHVKDRQLGNTFDPSSSHQTTRNGILWQQRMSKTLFCPFFRCQKILYIWAYLERMWSSEANTPKRSFLSKVSKLFSALFAASNFFSEERRKSIFWPLVDWRHGVTAPWRHDVTLAWCHVVVPSFHHLS